MEIHIPELEDLKNKIIKMRELINFKPTPCYGLIDYCGNISILKTADNEELYIGPAPFYHQDSIFQSQRYNPHTIATKKRESDISAN
jgi:hypothetical protein